MSIIKQSLLVLIVLTMTSRSLAQPPSRTVILGMQKELLQLKNRVLKLEYDVSVLKKTVGRLTSNNKELIFLLNNMKNRLAVDRRNLAFKNRNYMKILSGTGKIKGRGKIRNKIVLRA